MTRRNQTPASARTKRVIMIGGAACAMVVAAALPGTGHASPARATAPTLGTAASFAILAGSTVTNTGSSTVNGNLGVSPGSAVTGFPPGQVVPPGTIHAGDAVAGQAQSDATTAYGNLAGQACNFNLTGQNLGGKTLIPGTYCFSSSAQLTGALTLDGQGNPNAVFVFQIGSTLTTASDASVSLINGAQPCNVFWQVGSSSTLGTGTSFAGSILAQASNTLTTGASINGRAIALTGAVTTDTNTVAATQCGNFPVPTATSTAAVTSTATTPVGTPTATSLPETATAIAAATNTAIPLATNTAVAVATNTAIARVTATALVAATNTAIIAATKTAVAAPTFTAIAAATNTAVAAPTSTAIAAATNTAVAAPTFTAIAAATNTAVAAPTSTAIAAATNTAVAAPTSTAIAAATNTAVAGPTSTAIAAATNTAVAGPTSTAIAAATNTAVVASTNTAVAGATSTAVAGATATPVARTTRKPKAGSTKVATPVATPTSTQTVRRQLTPTPYPALTRIPGTGGGGTLMFPGLGAGLRSNSIGGLHQTASYSPHARDVATALQPSNPTPGGMPISPLAPLVFLGGMALAARRIMVRVTKR